MSNTWDLTWEKDSFTPIKNFITDSQPCRSLSLLLILHIHFPQVQVGNRLRFCNWSQKTFNWVKKSMMLIPPWCNSAIYFWRLNTLGPLVWAKWFFKSFHISRAVSSYMMLAWSFEETKLVNQVPTILSHLIHACTEEGLEINGDERVRVSSTNPNLFLVSKAFLTARAQAE